MNARHTPSLESLLERHREGGAFPTYAELSALAAPAAPSEQAAPINWLPTAENINALPEGIRSYAHQLEARCDPAGDVAQNVFLRDQCAGLQVMYRKAADALAEVRGCFEAAEVEGLAQALADTHDDRLKDLVQRRLNYAYEAACSAAAAPAAPLPDQPEALATITLGGIEGDELGDIDIEIIDMKRLEALQYQMVRTEDPVCLHLYALAGAAPLPELTGPSLTDDQCREIRERAAINTDLWSESQSFQPTPAQADAVFVREILASASPSPAPAPTEPTTDLPTASSPVSAYSEEARGKFEKWAEPRGYGMERTTDSYKSQGTKSAWRGWNGAIREFAESSLSSRMGGITSKGSAETAAQKDPDDSGLPCATCGGHGIVGYFVSNELAPIYDDQPCPDCSAETAAPGASAEDGQ